MRLVDSNQTLSAHLNRLLAGEDLARIELAKRMGVADGTLGRIKYGKANPTIDVVDKIARYFRLQPWELLQPIAQDSSQTNENRPVYGAINDGLRAAIADLTPEQQQALLSMIQALKAV